jgi:hypothetical protein
MKPLHPLTAGSGFLLRNRRYSCLRKKDTWDVERLPEQNKDVRCKWIFKINKALSHNNPPRFKAKLVAKGFIQIPRTGYDDVFSPVVVQFVHFLVLWL